MFSAISDGGAPAYENLSNYFLGGATRARPAPGGVPSKRARDAREPSKPGQQPSNGRTPIPTSSQKPGNREGNQRIPYARMMFTSMEDKAAPREIKGGDVIFVHKTSCAMGGAPNRCNKCTSIPQLNAILSKPSAGVTTLDLSDPTLAARIKQCRIKTMEDKVNEFEDWYQNEEVRNNKERMASIQRAIDKAKKKLNEIKAEKYITYFQPDNDWKALKMVSDWTLDGVLINVDDDVELDDTNQPQLSRDDGVLMNVCVQGPTPMRSTAPQISNSVEAHMWNPQYLDQGIHVMDKVFVGLFYVSSNAGTSISYYYKLFSGRQALSMDARLVKQGGDSFMYGPSAAEFLQCCGAWRVGSVMDNKLTTSSMDRIDRHIQINVVVEWWPVRKLRKAYSEDIGRAKKPDDPPPLLPPANEQEEILEAARQVEPEANDDEAEALARLAGQKLARERGQQFLSSFEDELHAVAEGQW